MQLYELSTNYSVYMIFLMHLRVWLPLKNQHIEIYTEIIAVYDVVCTLFFPRKYNVI